MAETNEKGSPRFEALKQSHRIRQDTGRRLIKQFIPEPERLYDQDCPKQTVLMNHVVFETAFPFIEVLKEIATMPEYGENDAQRLRHKAQEFLGKVL